MVGSIKISDRKSNDSSQQSSLSHTERAYASDWNHFSKWCDRRHRSALPCSPDILAIYLRECASKYSLKLSTIRRRLAAISEMHERHRLEPLSHQWPVRTAMQKLTREIGNTSESKKPITVSDLKKLLACCPHSLAGQRDRALLLIGFVSALRRSELVHLNAEDIAVADEGLVLTIRERNPKRSVKARQVGIPFGKDRKTCPVLALRAWLSAAEISTGPIFRAVSKFDRVRNSRLSDRAVADLIKKYCRSIGKRAALFSGHSLRSGFATAAALAGASERAIQRQTGHESLAALRRYTQEAEIFRDNAAKKLDL